MAYYSGSANTFGDLLSALVDACVAEGWSWSDGILNKGAAYVRPYTATTTTSTEGPGLLIQGGTGKASGALTGASDVIPRLGRCGISDNFAEIAFPVSYSIHIFDDPDEVFLIIRYSVDRFGWLTFGVSNVPGVPGTGLWLAGIARRGWLTSQSSTNGFGITPESGGSAVINTSSGAVVCPGFFWAALRHSSSADSRQDTIHTNFDGEGWAGGATISNPLAFNAIYPAIPLISYSPNAWNSEAVLVPIQGHVWRPASKCSLAVDVRNARYVRVDNYEPEQIVTLGPDAWKIYPFHRKDSTARDGAVNGLSHSGTFGWAIRYDGP